MSEDMSIDGIELVPGDRILLINQGKPKYWWKPWTWFRKTSPAPQNGVYIVGTGSWIKTSDEAESVD